MITCGSLFAGIGGFDLGLKRAGMRCEWQVEIDPQCRKVLERHFPDVSKHEDVRNVGRENLAAVDLICGGFPCQDLSVAGKRAGLAGERSGLWFEFHRIIAELKPQWVVIENVPGLLSSNRGADFAVVLRGLVECGYGVSWRVLDAQYFGLAQRRRRVFVVGSLGDGRAAQVLFESEGMFGHPPARGEAGQRASGDVAPSLAASGRGTERAGESRGQDPVIVIKGAAIGRAPQHGPQYGETLADGTCYTLNTVDRHAVAFGGETFVATFDPRNVTSKTNRSRVEPGLPASSLHQGGLSVAYNWQSGGDVRHNFGLPNLLAHQVPAVNVRRLTPTECERLQGFPDGWTAAGQSDSVRYHQLGNAVAVPVVEWIGRRIIAVECAGVCGA